MTSIGAVINELIERAGDGPMHETNTRVLLIDPMLSALGWDTLDPKIVAREYQVFDGSRVDYALRLSGKPVLFVEAKALGNCLTKPKLVAQIVNYANNHGVIWCALTNGLRWRVFKANEPVPMDEKLVFEVDLTAYGEGSLQSLQIPWLMGLLSIESIEKTRINQFWTDCRVRSMIEELFIEPSSEFLQFIRNTLLNLEISLSEETITDSLERLGKPDFPHVARAQPDHYEQPSEVNNDEHRSDYSRFFEKKPRRLLDLYEKLYTGIGSLEYNIVRYTTTQYIGHKISSPILYVIPKKQYLKLQLRLDPKKYVDHSEVSDTTGLERWGALPMEVRYSSDDQLDQIVKWVEEAAATVNRKR